ncbi:MAG TPA: IMP dehydrogenase [Weissella thailandensis]|uniref:IMP dehydrogenase n=1 Tax=Weissella thailandensis TaxID=89061 RepID=UPI001E0E1F75|nr:IMP dehydrogenase [Weissella thailandensis]HJG84742.1 IMP dehydrogenase [Weissella thailandensis]
MFSQNGLGLDDVLLVPSASDVLPNEIDISTQVTENMTLSIPVVGATRFTTVANAIDFAKEGTLAILPVQLSTPENVTKIKQLDNQYLVGVSVKSADTVDELVQAGADAVQVLPTDNQNFLVKNISEIKSNFNALPVWFGPVDDLEVAKQSLLAGADTIIIGTTTSQPLRHTVTTVMNFAEQAAKFDKNVILGSDIQYTGDVVKALAAGAVATMVDEKMITDSISDNLFQISGGLRSGMGYTGSDNVETLRQKAQFVQITSAGLTESHPHDIASIKAAPNYHV